MYEMVRVEKEMLHKLERELDELKIFLIGDTNKDAKCEDTEENCLHDTMRINGQTIDRCLGITSMIKEIIIGGDR